MKTILLTFDVEEFDLPRAYNKPLDKESEFEISKQGLISLTDLLKKHNVNATFFTTTSFAQRFPKLILKLEKSHEIASHGYSHSDNYSRDISKIKLAKEKLDSILKNKSKGFRAPRFNFKKISELHKFGFKYDSSLHPTWIPGKYFNLFKKRNIHRIGNVLEIPPSTLPLFRLPISWVFFKNTPHYYHKLFTKRNFLSADYTMLLFHPWEFANLEKIKIPKYIKRKHSQELLNLFEKYILFCKKEGYAFSSVDDYLKYNLQFIR